jgi:predicted membrane channel-forming protein YqfA (hemolysin III family)
MIQKLKFLILSSMSLFMFSLPLLAGTSSAYAATTQTDINNCLKKGSTIDLSGINQTTCPATNVDNNTNVTDLIKKIINILSVIIGAIAVIMIIIGGFRYVTSGGKQESVTAAKNTILYALVGLVIVALAQVIVHFVLNNVTTTTG